jgi:dihydroxyacetone kinase-like protein
MTAEEAISWLTAGLTCWATHAPELRDLDAAVGDGDLGVTVSHGVDAVRTALAALPEEPTPAIVSRAAGAAFAKGSPSTLAALVGGGLLAAAKALAQEPEFGYPAALLTLRTVAQSIAERGRASVGDKTILDALNPSIAAMESVARKPPSDVLDAIATAAQAGVDDTAGSIARRGRAAWLRERSAGHPDPGATAYALLLRCLQQTWPEPEAPAHQDNC